jgi:TetR/AcrR family transcriptional regulator, transcriptional repressor for nem operon
MVRNPEQTRTRIMDAAEALILDHGFAGTTVDSVIRKAGVTKGAFFHHFASKALLGHALVERFAAADAELFEHEMQRAERLSSDPLQQILIVIGLYQEMMEELDEPYLCLFASYCYQAQLFDDQTLEIIRAAFEHTRHLLLEKLEAVVTQRSPRIPIELESLADLVTVVFEGAFILARTMDAPEAISQQLQHYRNYLELLFGVTPAQSTG